MTTAGEAVVDPDAVVVGGEAVVGGVGAGAGVVIVPGAPSGVTREELSQLTGRVAALETAPDDHLHVQDVPSELWLVWHPLPDQPDAWVTGADGGRLYPRRQTYPGPGRLLLTFTRPVAGTAYLRS